MWFWAAMAACAVFDQLEEDVGEVVEDIEGVTAALVGQGLVLGVEEPTEPELQPLLDAGLVEPGTGVTLFLADAASADQMEESLVSGALAAIETPAGQVAVREAEPGVYTVDPVSGELAYVDLERWTILVDVGDGEVRRMGIPLPPAVDLDPPAAHAAGAALELDLTGQGYHSTLLVVTEVTSGSTTYTSQPETVEELYELAASGAEEVGVVTVPGGAFPGPGTYALGVAGLLHDTDDDLDGLNILLSRGMAGKMRLFPIVVE